MLTKINDIDLSRNILLETAFLDYCRFSYITDADIAVLYERIETLKKDFENDDEKALEIILKYDLESINSKEELKKRIQEQKAKIAEKIIETTKIEKTDNAESFIKNYLKSLGFKKDSEVLTEALLEQKLHEPYNEKHTKADWLATLLVSQGKKLKDNLAAHFKIYEENGIKNPLVENMRDDVEEYASSLPQKTIFHFLTKKEDKYFRDSLRQDFNAPDGVKVAFLKIYGHLMAAGKAVIYDENPSSSYRSFVNEMKAYFPNSYEKEMLQALDAKDMNECEAKFYQKAESLYIKTAAALLSKKKEFDTEHKIYDTKYDSYLSSTINQVYINGLTKGRNMVASLGLVEDLGPDYSLSRKEEFKYNKQLLGDMSDEQHVSIHHHTVTIGSAKDVTTRLFGLKDTDELKKTASAIVNTFGNMELIVGKEKHQSLEPQDNEIILEQKQKHAIFEARLNPEHIKSFSEDRRFPQKIRDALKKFEKRTDISEVMNFSESPIIANERAKLNQPVKKRTIINKFQQYLD